MPAAAGLDRKAGMALLDRAAETGLLTRYGSGDYAVHPAIPWHLHRLYEQHYGPPDSPPARHAIHAWTDAMSSVGDYWHSRYGQGHVDAIGFLELEEDNLLRARHLARKNGWWKLIIGAMQGLRPLYEHTGRTVEWRRLVGELTPDLTDPATDGPLPGREHNGPCSPNTACASPRPPGLAHHPAPPRRPRHLGAPPSRRVRHPAPRSTRRHPARNHP